MPDEDLKGYRELSQKLSAMGQRVGGKVLRSALMRSTTKVVREMRQAAPKGTKAHRTYKGRLVAPGFGARSIKRLSRITQKGAYILLGVKPEAWYLIQFYDERPGRTPYRITKRRIDAVGRRSTTKRHFRTTKRGRVVIEQYRTGRRGRRVQRIKPYTLSPKPWFTKVFDRNQRNLIRGVGQKVREILLKVAK